MASRGIRRIYDGMTLAALLAVGAGGDQVPRDRGVGHRLANFTLKDTSGKAVTLYGFRGKRAMVLAFTGVKDPHAPQYAARLAELHRQTKDKGAAFLLIDSNAG